LRNKKKDIKVSKNPKSFKIPTIFKIFIFLAVLVVFLAWYVSYLWFVGKDSYIIYQDLKNKVVKLKKNIKIMQLKNAKLQKEYFELKNLEPENE